MASYHFTVLWASFQNHLIARDSISYMHYMLEKQTRATFHSSTNSWYDISIKQGERWSYYILFSMTIKSSLYLTFPKPFLSLFTLMEDATCWFLWKQFHLRPYWSKTTTTNNRNFKYLIKEDCWGKEQTIILIIIFMTNACWDLTTCEPLVQCLLFSPQQPDEAVQLSLQPHRQEIGSG